MFSKRLVQLKSSLALSGIFLLVGSCFVAVLLSLSVQPHSLLELLIPAKVELQNSNYQTVYIQEVRLNALVMPDELALAPGQYALYVNGAYKDTLQVAGHATESNNQTNQQPVDQTQTQAIPSNVEVKNIDGIQAITWNEKSPQLFTFSLSDNLIMKKLSQHVVLWINQEKLFWLQINEVIFTGSLLLTLVLLTFHVTALGSSIVQPNKDWLQFFQSGWQYLPYTIVSAGIWSVFSVVVTKPLVGLLNTLDFPYRGNVVTGIIALVTAFILIRVSSIVTGVVRALYLALCVLSVGLIAALLAFYPLAPTLFMVVLILLAPVITSSLSSTQPIPLSGAGKVVDMTQEDSGDHNNEAWRETLL